MSDETVSISAYLINLQHQEDRFASSIEEAKKLDLEIIRVNAVNSKDIEGNIFVTKGVRAAWLSHLKAMQTFLSTDAEYAFILEDDFNIDNREGILKFLYSKEYRNWDMIQFGYLTPGIDIFLKVKESNIENTVFRYLYNLSKLNVFSLENIRNRLRVKLAGSTPSKYIPDDCQPGAHFYLINRKFATAIVALNDPQFLSIDDFYIALAKMRIFKMLRPRKSFVSQKPFEAWKGSRFIRD